MSDEEIPPPEAFLLSLLHRSMRAKEKSAEINEKATSPSLTVKIPLAIVHKMVDQVTCNCDMCLGVYIWAKSIDMSPLDDEMRAIFRLSLVAAESRLIHDRLSTEYRKTYQHGN